LKYGGLPVNLAMLFIPLYSNMIQIPEDADNRIARGDPTGG
jgi:hypothetical protein